MIKIGPLPDPIDLIRRYQINPKKSLGQNFLIDRSHLSRIIEAAALSKADTVVEIGPGPGLLTHELAARACHLVAVELDDRLIELLQADFATAPHVRIVHGDILQLPVASLLPPGSIAYKVVANLPYYITSAVLRHLLESTPRPSRAVLMVQKEVAERICAAPGDLSILAVSVQFYGTPTIVHHVPAQAFYPRPQVDSAVLCVDVFPEPAVTDVSPKRFFAVVRAGFSQKRKQLANSLSAGLNLPKSMVQDSLLSANVAPERRAETVTIPEWRLICLALDEASVTRQ
jgi:16S rRNA (adenine1518-N6/adenine1519-N6)-dimethyltransferase